jgi:hypothetical protein
MEILPGVAGSISGLTIRNGTGGILSYGSATLSTTAVINNNAGEEWGGGIASYGPLTVLRSTIANNTTDSVGGGLWTRGDTTIANSTISGNSSTGGGGIRVRGEYGRVTIINSTITGNNGAPAGGIYEYAGVVTPPVIKNTIISGNSDGDCSGTLTSGGHNLIGSTSNCTGITNGTNGDQVGASANLGPLQNNGGPTDTIALQSGSKAIDAGDDSICGASPVAGQDQTGNLRPAGPHCDIGAFEVPAAHLSISIARGWNLISMAQNDSTITSLGALTSALNTQLGVGSIQAVAVYVNHQFVPYVPGYSRDVALSPGSGVMVLSGTAGTWQPGGSAFTAGQAVSLQPGWNMVAAPFPAPSLDTGTIAAQTGACDASQIAVAGTSGYRTWLPGQTDLTIPSTHGFWILCSGAATWTPT